MTGKKITLGARILANFEDEVLHPIDAARKKAAAAGKAQDFDTVEQLFERFKAHLTKSVENGGFPKPLRLTGPESSALNTYSWEPTSLGPAPRHFAFALWQQLASWADSEEILIAWKFGHDGVGIDSWWDLVVAKPKAAAAKH